MQLLTTGTDLKRGLAMSTLFEQLGGAPAMSAAVEVFYRKVLSDERIAHFFDGVDMDKQMAKQQAFLTMVTGGPSQYSGRDMRAAHAHLITKGLSDVHVDAVIEHLGATLSELGVSAEAIAQVAAIANSVRDQVLNRGPA